MLEKYGNLLSLPHTQEEKRWLKERLETLSAKESIALTAAMLCSLPTTMVDAVNILISLQDYTVCVAKSYDYLADYYLREHGIVLPDSVKEHTDMVRIGRMYEKEHPGMFIGDYYAAYPKNAPTQHYD